MGGTIVKVLVSDADLIGHTRSHACTTAMHQNMPMSAQVYFGPAICASIPFHAFIVVAVLAWIILLVPVGSVENGREE